MGDQPPRPRIRGRRIVERPRLTALLDRSRAPVRTLVAGPGYGKTILLEQWAPRDGRTVGWYRARRSAVDVAVVARELVSAVAPILPGAGRRMLERLSVTEDPEREAVLLGEMLAEDLAEWPGDAWIVIDDYHHLAQAEGSERFVEVLATRSPAQLLIASRERPLWVHGKALLYGDVFELTQPMLAMTLDEAEQVLEGSRLDLSSGLLTLAEGWPAVIGLAGMAPDVTEIDADMPDTLYAFFAEEVYRGLGPTLAEALTLLAALPTVDRELAEIVLGHDEAAEVCAEALALGILDARDDSLEFHPLAAAFLAKRSRIHGVPGVERALAPAFELYRKRKEWDSAIEVAASMERGALELSGLLLECQEELLDNSRLTTLERSVKVVASRDGETPAVRLARASLALRQGSTVAAQALAESLLEAPEVHLRFRGAMLAGAAAHAGSREEFALRHFSDAEELASDERGRIEARWGQLMAATALELSSAPVMLESLMAETGTGRSALDVVRGADKKLALGLRFGTVSTLGESRQAAELLGQVDNPVVRASFRATFSCALNLASDYASALEVANDMHAEATELRIDFAQPYGSLMRAAALAGLKQFADADTALDQALEEARRCSDTFAQQGVYAARVRLLLQTGRAAEACALEPPDLRDSLPGMRGEVMGSRGLAMACFGRLGEAVELERALEGTSHAIEAATLRRCIGAVVAVRRRDPDLLSTLSEWVHTAYETGGVDLVVTTYRASPDVLTALLTRPETAEIAGYIVARAADQDLAAVLGVSALDTLDPLQSLTRREREVYDLAVQGIKAPQVAKTLFISLSTAKLYLHRIYHKMGVNSQAALILDAVNRGRGQAAPSAGAEDGAS